MKRKIIHIDEDKCNGCGECIPNCAEGALQVIDGKARLVSDLFCDGLGACIGHCPLDAITIEEREAEPYDAKKVMAKLVDKGENVVRAHLEHLKNHNQLTYLREAIEYLVENGLPSPFHELNKHQHSGGCPGSKIIDMSKEHKISSGSQEAIRSESMLRQWPIQMHLINPLAPYFKKADVLLAADCTAFTSGGFHNDFLEGKSLVIACPKLDSGKDIYRQKLTMMIDEARINTLTVLIMEVPCCNGLLELAKEALAHADRRIPIKKIVLSIRGEITSEEWL